MLRNGSHYSRTTHRLAWPELEDTPSSNFLIPYSFLAFSRGRTTSAKMRNGDRYFIAVTCPLTFLHLAIAQNHPLYLTTKPQPPPLYKFCYCRSSKNSRKSICEAKNTKMTKSNGYVRAVTCRLTSQTSAIA